MNPKRAFQVVYTILVLNFLLPAISYIVAPQMTYQTLDQVNRLLGGGPYPAVESGHLWHMLGTGNVFTLLQFADAPQSSPNGSPRTQSNLHRLLVLEAE